MPQVQLYVYDLSGGLARQLSPIFLGKQIDGIWHTGVVVYGKEFFYGGMGVEFCAPGGTIVGQPHKVENLGETQIPEEIFQEYLADLAPQYGPDKYNLLDHNCNNFSNEVAQFLTGNPIPSRITNLPAEVLETPFGAQIRPFLEMLTGPGSGGQPVGGLSPPAGGGSGGPGSGGQPVSPPAGGGSGPGSGGQPVGGLSPPAEGGSGQKKS